MQPNEQNARHIGLVGDTYTILLTGEDTAGRYCLIDMHIPPGGGTPPHRHDFEESLNKLQVGTRQPAGQILPGLLSAKAVICFQRGA